MKELVTATLSRTAVLFGLACALLGCISCAADTTAPEVSYAYPTNGARLTADTVELKVVAKDNEGIYYVEFIANTSTVGLDSRGDGDTFTSPWVPETTGMYFLKAIAADKAGNEGFAPGFKSWSSSTAGRQLGLAAQRLRVPGPCPLTTPTCCLSTCLGKDILQVRQGRPLSYLPPP